ncbi:non-specific lipid transfer protein GPI-anchored 14-like [Salvia hispanica]|uniref:non-specific lipid transfer protein GPI-anchored 14-like n=1 Tax=Salvia hispanica TaxID=49212 RepID=UPI0020098614|nr:non-specific lipid transfer protein GPI-anchored 14-like [Salvia hispanica]
MEVKKNSVLLKVVLVLLVSVIARCDVDKDREKCANDLVGLATCLPYVSGEAKSPPIDCCTGLKQVLQKSPQCICLLVKDRNDPSLGFKINATLALSLPSQCHAEKANVTDCTALLHLAPNSPDAKVFEDFANSGKKTNATAPSAADTSSGKASAATTTTSTKEVSGGGGKKQSYWLGVLFTMVVAYNLSKL